MKVMNALGYLDLAWRGPLTAAVVVGSACLAAAGAEEKRVVEPERHARHAPGMEAAARQAWMAPAFTLRDQYRKTHDYRFPSERPHLLFMADRHAAHDVVDWYKPIIACYGDADLDMYGVAALDDLPWRWRPFVGILLRREVDEPVMLDWDDEIVARYDFKPRAPNLYVITPEGEIALHLHGAVNPEGLDKLAQALAPYVDAACPEEDEADGEDAAAEEAE